MAENVLSVRDLHICYETDHGVVNAVNGISFDIKKGETLGMVGESGAGVFFHAGREVVGADGQHPTEGYQGQIRVHIVLIQFLQRPHAQ